MSKNKPGKKYRENDVKNQNDSTTEKNSKSEEKGKLKRKIYEEQMAKLHRELVKLQEWIKNKGLKVVVIFEGRDAAGKGGGYKENYAAS